MKLLGQFIQKSGMHNLETDVTLPRMKQPDLPPSIFLTFCPTQDYLGMNELSHNNE